jgi:acyl-CoA thioester hydrolase
VPHRLALKVRFSELDPYNHVNHSVYVTYFEAARTEALAAVGLALDRLGADGHQIVVSELTVRYRVPAGPGDELVVETVVDEVRGASSIWSQTILRGDEVVATARLRAGFTDATGRPARIPADVRDRLESLV